MKNSHITSSFSKPPFLSAYSTGVVNLLQLKNLHGHIIINRSPDFTKEFTLAVVASVCYDKSVMTVPAVTV